ncbi:prolyl-tRNA synthetase [Sodiomyces alkalinus F11]|uniref:proline--tRNA ligase n=1 Tax=Sodiomyces alkalinus (strain CBS 110278 / VKM F-3762 / F11) TaxID=1314773 RepID=A0A3N2Q038_SODAK|nr:prolyl-tRNA synthetase [Sodiomyces alkalinus F11]ROT40102.1 prolyl-tRNA synthetase [Sodiomyces alkalinus F11]
MSFPIAVRKPLPSASTPTFALYAPTTRRSYNPLQWRAHSTSHRQCLSSIWIPKEIKSASPNEDAHGKLARAGFLRQSHAGIYHMLPLGRRVQDKLERLLDYHMRGLGASRISLSSITSKQLWEQSGRFSQLSSEVFNFRDRKGAEYLLSPTHEEEVTALVAQSIHSYRELPLRLYQITRKYRDEMRPRHGLLRTREFTMKDLYTFDATTDSAQHTYAQVQNSYTKFFTSLGLPFVKVEANSGDMGGSLSHEYHLPTSIGDDLIVTCSQCDYAANDEILQGQTASPLLLNHNNAWRDIDWQVWRGISKDRKTLVNAWVPIQLSRTTGSDGLAGVSLRAIETVVPELDSSVDRPLTLWAETVRRWSHDPIQHRSDAMNPRVLNLIDHRLAADPDFRIRDGRGSNVPDAAHLQQIVVGEAKDGTPLDLLGVSHGDRCPRCCAGELKVEKALEIGHTFHLGTRYSEPLGATISLPGNADPITDETPSSIPRQAPIQMGCYGIGVSRLIGAIAEHLVDDRGLQWPRAIAPFEVAILSAPDLTTDGTKMYDMISDTSRSEVIDVVLDDRAVSLPWKMKDADLVGYPVMVILGKHWKAEEVVEVQCRRLGIRSLVRREESRELVYNLLQQLSY